MDYRQCAFPNWTIVETRFGLTAPIEEEMPYWLNLEPIPSMLPSWDERGCRILP